MSNFLGWIKCTEIRFTFWDIIQVKLSVWSYIIVHTRCRQRPMAKKPWNFVPYTVQKSLEWLPKINSIKNRAPNRLVSPDYIDVILFESRFYKFFSENHFNDRYCVRCISVSVPGSDPNNFCIDTRTYWSICHMFRKVRTTHIFELANKG